MTDTEKDNLLYRPELRPERNYLSDGDFVHPPAPAMDMPEEETDDTPKKLYDDFKEIEELIRALPDTLHFISKSIEKLRTRITIIYPNGYIPPEPEPNIIVPGQKKSEKTPYNPQDGTYTLVSSTDPTRQRTTWKDDGTYIPRKRTSEEVVPKTDVPGSFGHPEKKSYVTPEYSSTEKVYTKDESIFSKTGEPLTSEKKSYTYEDSDIQLPEDEYAYNNETEETKRRKRVKPEDVNIINHIPIRDNPALRGLPDLFPQPNNVVLTIEQPKTLVQLIQNAYAKDQVELDKYYSQQLQIIMQRYFQQMLALMADCGVSSIEDLTQDFDGEQVKIPYGQGLEHLRDFIVRSQVQRNQMSRLFKKTHSVDKTLMHMRSWHAAEAQRERYYGEKYMDSSSYTDSHSNSLLRESRASYDSAYSTSFYNMYKYLNSSVMMTNDILNATVKEAQAKAELLKNGVDIYAFDQQEAEFAASATDSGQTGDGKGSGWDEGSSSSDSSEKTESDAAKTDEKTDEKEDSSSSGSSSSPSDSSSQYQNDLDYLKNNGYTEEAAKEELAKLPQYQKKEETIEAPTVGGGIFGDIAKDSQKTVTGALTGMAKDVLSGKSISSAAKDALNSVTSSLKNNAVKAATDAIKGSLGKDVISDVLKKAVSGTSEKKITGKTDAKGSDGKKDKKNDASKYPAYNQFSDDDDILTHNRKRAAQIRQDLRDIEEELAQIQKERKEMGKSTYRHNDLLKLNKQKKKLMAEYQQVTA